MSSAETLLREIDAFLERTGITQTRFGVEAMNNSSFVRQLRKGGSVTLRTVDKVREFMSEWEIESRKRRTRPKPRAVARAVAA